MHIVRAHSFAVPPNLDLNNCFWWCNETDYDDSECKLLPTPIQLFAV